MSARETMFHNRMRSDVMLTADWLAGEKIQDSFSKYSKRDNTVIDEVQKDIWRSEILKQYASAPRYDNVTLN